jgi:hypothetical protein
MTNVSAPIRARFKSDLQPATTPRLHHHAVCRFALFFLGGNSSPFIGGLPTPAPLEDFQRLRDDPRNLTRKTQQDLPSPDFGKPWWHCVRLSMPPDLLPCLLSFISRVCSGSAPEWGGLQTRRRRAFCASPASLVASGGASRSPPTGRDSSEAAPMPRRPSRGVMGLGYKKLQLDNAKVSEIA